MGRKHTPEARQRMAEIKKREWASLTPEEREARAEKQRGLKKPKTSEALRGKQKSPEHIEKLRNGKWIECTNCRKSIYRPAYLLGEFEHSFCSRRCFTDWQAAQKEATRNKEICLWCGKEFYRQPSRAKYNHGNHYCSKECANQARSGEGHHNWTGGRTKRPDGYIDMAGSLVPEQYKSMARKDGLVMEHRLVMAMHMGRPLESWEVVHHVNGVKDDNRIENLELHPAMTHLGITTATNKEIGELKAEISRLKNRLKELGEETQYV